MSALSYKCSIRDYILIVNGVILSDDSSSYIFECLSPNGFTE